MYTNVVTACVILLATLTSNACAFFLQRKSTFKNGRLCRDC